MRIVTTATHPIFSFHCIPLFLFSSLILSSKPHICTSKQMQIESRASSSLECYAEMQLCLCKAS